MIVASLRAGTKGILRVEVLPVPAVLLNDVSPRDDLYRGDWTVDKVRDAPLMAATVSVADAREFRALRDSCRKV